MQAKKSHLISDALLIESARQFAVLSEPSRLLLIRELMAGERTVTELVNASGLKQGNVSKHLAILQQNRFVTSRREGNYVRYAIGDARLFELCDLMCQRIQHDAKAHATRLAG